MIQNKIIKTMILKSTNGYVLPINLVGYGVAALSEPAVIQFQLFCEEVKLLLTEPIYR